MEIINEEIADVKAKTENLSKVNEPDVKAKTENLSKLNEHLDNDYEDFVQKEPHCWCQRQLL